MPDRILALSLGNSSLRAALFSGDRLVRRFQAPLAAVAGPGAMERLLARWSQGRVDLAAMCSVVPAATGRAARAMARALGRRPLLLSADGPHGLQIAYRRPRELGADRLAAAIGARRLFPDRNLVVVDCGTATTITALGRRGVILGGAILPGLGLWAGMLAERTAQLPRVEPGRRPRTAVGRSTADALWSGTFFGHAGAIRELVSRVRKEAFGAAGAVVVGTGGHSARFLGEKLFDKLEPDLVLRGLLAYAQAADDRR
jgi:type III pantothenate kinase